MNKLLLQDISKKFKYRVLFENVNIQFEEGKIYGIVGPNGSGKSVLFKIISGIMRPSTGKVFYNNQQLHKDIQILPSVGVVINTPQFYKYLTGFENLFILASIKNDIGEEEILAALHKVGLEKDKIKVKDYSTGMLQRLSLAQAIMENPDILILDEITNGIDKSGLNMIYNLLIEEKKKNKILIITSHRAQDIDTLCDEVYEIDDLEVKKIEKENIN